MGVNGLGVVKPEIPDTVNEETVYGWFNKTIRSKKKLTITDECLELINRTIKEPEFDGFRFIDTLITYQNALAGDRVNLEEYINAVRFCSFLEVTNGNATEAYIKTFNYRGFVKDRVEAAKNTDAYKQLASAATRYRKSPLVVNIMTQAEVPLWLMFQGYRYQAVNVLVKEMNNAPLPKDRINAADRLLFHLKPPENIKVELEVGLKQDNIVDQYEAMLGNMVKEQKRLIESGSSLNNIANIKASFIDAEVVGNG